MNLTVKELKEAIKDLPDDGIVYVQRIEDAYFTGADISGMTNSANGEVYPPGSKANGWDVKKVKSEFYYQALIRNKQMIKEIKRRKEGKKPTFSAADPSLYIATQEELDDMNDEYIKSSCAVNHDKENLYINCHY